jgi:hypothetical protein
VQQPQREVAATRDSAARDDVAVVDYSSRTNVAPTGSRSIQAVWWVRGPSIADEGRMRQQHRPGAHPRHEVGRPWLRTAPGWNRRP